MIAIGNGEVCPFCKGDDKFICTKDNNFMKHCQKNHEAEFMRALFGNKNVGL